ncbi:uncharacterized protein LOC108468429 [Gossypium arboreum]|uniref:RNase H type-1 domain-containing protein n=1 Tax=Gossypium arboreum TaxID=29729 RepID=A0ABR0NYT3_GOSAR|nr:uncharacterized protein LOC108468429 [Gossypium arboreum]KAK5811060.1 hypothetical protein PVK06_026379 [Gossypium arboreum]
MFNWWNDTSLWLDSVGAKDQVGLLGYICWNLWNSRNRFIFENKNEDPVFIWMKAMREAMEFNQRGSAPTPNSVKINCDSSWNPSNQTAGIATVARDSFGKIMQGLNACVQVSSVRVAEALAVRSGAVLAVHRQWSNVALESDNKELMTSLEADLDNCWGSKAIEADIKSLLASVNYVVNFISKSWVAKMTRTLACPFDWVLFPPADLARLVSNDSVSF